MICSNLSGDSGPFCASMRREDDQCTAAMISFSNSSLGFQALRAIRHYESAHNARKRSMASYSAARFELLDDNLCEEDSGSDDCAHFGDKKRKLTFEQAKTLEKSFEVGDKLDPERKLQLARTLGLQPKQIAVWFQNRRVRSKTKQLKRDYDALRHDYDALKTNYDTLLKERTQFRDEAQRLKRELENKDESNCMGKSVSELEPQQKCALINATSTSFTEISPKSEIFIKSRALCEKDSQEGGCSSIVSEGSSVLNMDNPRTIGTPLSPQFTVRDDPCELIRRVLAEQSDYGPKNLPNVEEERAVTNEAEEAWYNLFYSYEEQEPMLWEYEL